MSPVIARTWGKQWPAYRFTTWPVRRFCLFLQLFGSDMFEYHVSENAREKSGVYQRPS